MKVYVLVDLIMSNPENPGALVFTTLEAAKQAEQRMIKAVAHSDEYVTSIIAAEVQQ